MDWTLEVVVLPVSDISRSIAFYRDQVGFNRSGTVAPAASSSRTILA
jgi:catechol 2,3-dioxygenase-like lactoylglutathione lyase family enzyme